MFIFLKKFINVMLLTSVMYLILIKRFYIQEVLCRYVHDKSKDKNKTRMMCNKYMSTLNLIFIIIAIICMYIIVCKSAIDIIFNSPLFYTLKLIYYYDIGIKIGYYLIFGIFTYFVYHGVMAYMYLGEYDLYYIRNHNWNQSSTAHSMLIWLLLVTFFLIYYNTIKTTL